MYTSRGKETYQEYRGIQIRDRHVEKQEYDHGCVWKPEVRANLFKAPVPKLHFDKLRKVHQEIQSCRDVEPKSASRDVFKSARASLSRYVGHNDNQGWSDTVMSKERARNDPPPRRVAKRRGTTTRDVLHLDRKRHSTFGLSGERDQDILLTYNTSREARGLSRPQKATLIVARKLTDDDWHHSHQSCNPVTLGTEEYAGVKHGRFNAPVPTKNGYTANPVLHRHCRGLAMPIPPERCTYDPLVHKHLSDHDRCPVPSRDIHYTHHRLHRDRFIEYKPSGRDLRRHKYSEYPAPPQMPVVLAHGTKEPPFEVPPPIDPCSYDPLVHEYKPEKKTECPRPAKRIHTTHHKHHRSRFIEYTPTGRVLAKHPQSVYRPDEIVHIN
uniref:Uncharacterized protein n=1 Tax=Mucochytrium quahogii TaxID=96639 RepID=A0A7S2WFU8_9STRA|mmetsp:Transcript_2262/g.4613  ORF Transcript_2262/g.4613 Transcript_2262/m.4613 type:complete len:382 (+) Transcript_2262:155-1300(+)